MLCCISRKACQAPKLRQNSLVVRTNNNTENSSYLLPASVDTEMKINPPSYENEKLEEVEDEPSMLLPCAICARTFKPQSLDKHIKICERAAAKKRKPFDSSKQRIQGTELEEFLPRETPKLNHHEDRLNSKASWKQHHDEFLKKIRAAREDSMDGTPNRQTGLPNVNPGAPTRANEKGQCPTCYRQFGIKAYDRHVAWCKERIIRAPSSPATNIAKERLDARINYRAPSLKNRRMTNREKYAPGNFSMTNITNKNNTSPPSSAIKGIKDNLLPVNGNKHMENPIIKQSAVAEKRMGQAKGDGVITTGPLKSRLSDRSFKRIDNPELTFPPIYSPQMHNDQYPLHELSNQPHHQNNSMSNATSSIRHSSMRKSRVRGSRKSRKQRNIVITRSHGNPTVNDVTVNNDAIGMTVTPYVNFNRNGLITWKEIHNGKVKIQCIDPIHESDEFIHLNKPGWISSNLKLDQTYSINKSVEIDVDNITRVIDRSSNHIDFESLTGETITDLNELPPITPIEFNIDVTSTSTPVTFGINTDINDSISINPDNAEYESTIDANDNTKRRCDTYTIEEIVESSDLIDAQELVENHEQTNGKLSDASIDSNDEDDIKINSSPTTDSNESCLKIPQINDIILVDAIPTIDNICLSDNAETLMTPSHDFTSDSLDSFRSNRISMNKKLRKKMHLLRDSTDLLISSIETNNERMKGRYPTDSHSAINRNVNDRNMINQQNADEYQIFPDISRNRGIEKQRILPEREMPYWKRMMKTSRRRFINNLNLLKNPKINSTSLPPLVPVQQRNDVADTRPPWINYVRRHPDFNLVLTGRIGMCQDYDPFFIAERQLNDLLSDTCSDQSYPELPSSQYKKSKSPHYPLTSSSAFVKYPNPLSIDNPSEKRPSLIAPPTEFDDLSIGFSSDSTETNSITRELFTELESSHCRRENMTNKIKDNQPILGRRVIIEKSKALGCTDETFNVNSQNKDAAKSKNHKAIGKIVPSKVVKPQFTRSNSVRAASAPKNEERNDLCYKNKMKSRSSSGSRFCNKNNNYRQNNGSNLSLSSIVSSDNETKRSNFVFDDIMNSFDDDSISYPSLSSFLKNDSLSTSSPIQVSRNDNGQVNDDDLSSPDSYKRQDHSKVSVDSAYSSLNRKYSNHGVNSSEITNRRNEIIPTRRNIDNEVTSTMKSKMSKFCHECGTKFPDTAKFCCECGVQRLSL